jgi:hypothetical protein
MSDQNYRLYAFVAGGYLSQLQLGLQTAHAVANISVKYSEWDHQDDAYRTWAAEDKVIIIYSAFNSQGVLDCFAELSRTGTALDLPMSIFFEDQESLNGAATACAVVVPQKYWDAKPLKDAANEIWAYEFVDENFVATTYPLTHPEGQFIHHLKQFRLA